MQQIAVKELLKLSFVKKIIVTIAFLADVCYKVSHQVSAEALKHTFLQELYMLDPSNLEISRLYSRGAEGSRLSFGFGSTEGSTSQVDDHTDDSASNTSSFDFSDEINTSTSIILNRREPNNLHEFVGAVKTCLYDIEEVLNSLFGKIPYELKLDLDDLRNLLRLLISEYNRFREIALASGLRASRVELSYRLGCGFGDFIRKGWEAVKSGAKAVYQTVASVATKVTQVVQKTYNFVCEKVVTPIKNAAVSVFNTTRNTVVSAWKTASSTLSQWKGSIVGAWKNFWENHGEGIKKHALNAVHFFAKESIKYLTGHYLVPGFFNWLGFLFPGDDWFGTDSGWSPA